MLLRLALRNVAKTLPKRAVFGVFFSVTVALLFVGNSLFESSDKGLSATYVKSFTGQASVAAPSDEQFTIFGSDLPLVGEFLVLPLLPDADGLRQVLRERLPQARFLTQVSAAGSLALEGYQQPVPVFGVDFRAYFDFFPSLQLLSGSLPDVTEPSLLLTDVQARSVEATLGRPLVVGDRFTLTYAVNNSFVIREVHLAGVYAYPSTDLLLDRIVLTDPDTARALNGYLYGGSDALELDDSTKRSLESDLDDLFSDAGDSVVDPGSEGTSAADRVQDLASETVTPRAPGSLEGAWNFLLVSAPGDDQSLVRALREVFADREVQIRDWRETAGGTALVAWFLRWVFNLGLLFIAVVSCMILINSLALSILERTREIGTMRALGAAREFIGGLIAWETVLVVVGAGLLGVGLGIVACEVLTSLHLRLDNVYLASLFGGQELAIQVSWQGVLMHVLMSFLLGAAAIVLPIRRALAIDPVKAIARDQ